MIQTENLTTTVKFGNTKPTISIYSKHRKLALQMILPSDKQISIGDRLKDDDIQEFPKIEMHFLNEQSVDVMIKVLEQIKESFNPYKLHCFPLAG